VLGLSCADGDSYGAPKEENLASWRLKIPKGISGTLHWSIAKNRCIVTTYCRSFGNKLIKKSFCGIILV
jgi:hypothetical protein